MAESTAVWHEGRRFRSALEARWAIFLDTLGVAWRHGHSINLGELGRRRPSFWLPKQCIWMVVTAEESDITCQRCSRLTERTNRSVVLFQGSPSYQIQHQVAVHFIFQVLTFHTWSPPDPVIFPEANEDFEMRLLAEDGLREHLERNRYIVDPFDGSPESIRRMVDQDRDYWQRVHGGEHPHWRYGFRMTGTVPQLNEQGQLIFDMPERSPDTPITRAIDAALVAKLESEGNSLELITSQDTH